MPVWVDGTEYFRAYCNGQRVTRAFAGPVDLEMNPSLDVKLSDSFSYSNGTWLDQLPIYGGNGEYPRQGNGVWYRDSPKNDTDHCFIWPAASPTSAYQAIEGDYVVPALYDTTRIAYLMFTIGTPGKGAPASWVGIRHNNRQVFVNTVIEGTYKSSDRIHIDDGTTPFFRVEKDTTRMRVFKDGVLVWENELPDVFKNAMLKPVQGTNSFRDGNNTHKGSIEWSTFNYKEYNHNRNDDDMSWFEVRDSKTVVIPGFAKYVDVVALGGGSGGVCGNGGNTVAGEGGKPGEFASICWAAVPEKALTISIGAGGAGGNGGSTSGKAGGSTKVTISTTGESITAKGGASVGAQNNGKTGYGSGDYTYTPSTAYSDTTKIKGSTNVGMNTDGAFPGGGGGGGGGGILNQFSNGRNGASGAVWYRFRSQ